MDTRALSITLRSSAGTFRGTVQDTQLSRERVSMTGEFSTDLPPLPIGGLVTTELAGPGASSPLELEAAVVLQSRSERVGRCTVSYPTSEVPRLISVLNRRKEIRIRPSAALPVVGLAEGNVAVQVADVSTGGVALLVTENQQGRLARWTIRFSLQFPDEDPVLFVGNVRVRRLAGASILYGIEFDPERTPDLAKKQTTIHEYVMARQSEMLRERRRRRLA